MGPHHRRKQAPATGMHGSVRSRDPPVNVALVLPLAVLHVLQSFEPNARKTASLARWSEAGTRRAIG